jgi:glycosyltransferase involved in cell wall biosynthesis
MPPFDPHARPIEDRRITFIVPGSIETRTGGYEYDRRIIEQLRARRWIVDVWEIDKGAALPPLRDGGVVVVDGLTLDSISDAEDTGRRLKLVLIVHMPGASGIDEGPVLKAARAIVVTGPGAKRAIVAGGVDTEWVTIVEPGTMRVPDDLLGRPTRNESGSGIVRFLSVGNVTEGKGHDRLVSALRLMSERNWHLTIVGSLSRDPAAAAGLRGLIRELALEDRIDLTGELAMPALRRHFLFSDAFVLATLHETYGMAVAEAIASQLPVVSTSVGEIPKIVGDGGIIVPADDVGALAAALKRFLNEPALRVALRAGARRARERLSTWDHAGDEMSALLERVSND